jgi:hypothetical protein
LIESASLVVWKWAMALNGTGVAAAAAAVPDPPPPPPPEAAVPVAAGLDVPLSDVVALDPVLAAVLALERTDALEPAVDPLESAEVEPTPAVEADAVVLFVLSADVDAPALETPEVADGVSMEFPELAAPPEPAPDDDPAVFEAVSPAVPLVVDD